MNQDQDQRSRAGDDEAKRAAELSNELQPDPQLIEGPAGRGRIWSYAVVIVLILAAVFYGVHKTSQQASNPPPAVTQSQPSPSHAAGNTAAPNTQPGTTTGSATNRPTSPQGAPTGTEIDRANQPPFTGQSK